MAKGFGGGGLPGNLQAMMKQAQKLQKDVADTEKKAREVIHSFQAGGGVAKLEMDGFYNIKGLSLSPECLDPEDPKMVEELVTAIFTEALTNVKKFVDDKIGEVTGGVSIPGLT